MNKDSWIALFIASVITVLAAAPLYYSRGPIGSRGEVLEGSGTMTTEQMKKIDGNSGPNMPVLDHNK